MSKIVELSENGNLKHRNKPDSFWLSGCGFISGVSVKQSKALVMVICVIDKTVV